MAAIGGEPQLAFMITADAGNFVGSLTSCEGAINNFQTAKERLIANLQRLQTELGSSAAATKNFASAQSSLTQIASGFFSQLTRIGSIGRQVIGIVTSYNVWQIRVTQYQNQLRESMQRYNKIVEQVIGTDERFGDVTEKVADIINRLYKTQLTAVGSFDAVRKATGNVIINMARFGSQSEEANAATLEWEEQLMSWAEKARYMEVRTEKIQEVIDTLSTAIRNKQIPDWRAFSQLIEWNTEAWGPLGTAGMRAEDVIAKTSGNIVEALEWQKTATQEIKQAQEDWSKSLEDAIADITAAVDKLTVALEEARLQEIAFALEWIGIIGTAGNLAIGLGQVSSALAGLFAPAAVPAAGGALAALTDIEAGAALATPAVASTSGALASLGTAAAAAAPVLLGAAEIGGMLAFTYIECQKPIEQQNKDMAQLFNTIGQVAEGHERERRVLEGVNEAMWDQIRSTNVYGDSLDKLYKRSPIPDVIAWTEKQTVGLQTLQSELEDASSKISTYGLGLSKLRNISGIEQQTWQLGESARSVEELDIALNQLAQPKELGGIFIGLAEKADASGLAAGKIYWQSFESVAGLAETQTQEQRMLKEQIAVYNYLQENIANYDGALDDLYLSIFNVTAGTDQQISSLKILGSELEDIVSKIEGYSSALFKVQNIPTLQRQAAQLEESALSVATLGSTFRGAFAELKGFGDVFESFEEKAGESGAVAGKIYRQNFESLIGPLEISRFLAAQKLPIEAAGAGGIVTPFPAAGGAIAKEEGVPASERQINYNFGDIHIHVQQLAKEQDMRETAYKLRRFIQMDTARTR